MHDSLTHIDDQGQVSMVDISSKEIVNRKATAECLFVAKESTIEALLNNELDKGEGIAVARVAGIQAAKQCSNLIPLCHPLTINCVEIVFERMSPCNLKIVASVTVQGRTGVEMEALTSASVAALTLWDMTKAIDDSLAIENITLVAKSKKPLIAAL